MLSEAEILEKIVFTEDMIEKESDYSKICYMLGIIFGLRACLDVR